MIDLSFLPRRPVAVVGLGQSGRATIQALLAVGIQVWAWDDNEDVRAAATDLPLLDPEGWNLGEASALILSPGIPLHHPAPHPLVTSARAADCEVIGDIELFCRAMKDAAIIGVTGTNGKSTTTALIGHILSAAGRPNQVGGNIGTPALALDPLGPDGVYVLELSSYQLDLTPSLTCAVGVMLNISPDHLSRHGGFDGYVQAKRKIFRRMQGWRTAVVGVDDSMSKSMADDLRADVDGPRVVPISGRTNVDGGVFAQAGVLFDGLGGAPAPVLDLETAVALPGDHNAQNAAAAYAAVHPIGVSSEDAAAAIASFPGLAHRQERVGQVNGVIFVNDSKATNADAAARALTCYDAVYWIAGGRPKETGLDPVMAFLGRVRSVFLIGEATERFATALADRVPVVRCGTLDRAVTEAYRAAGLADEAHPVVLLSPACASFDQFPNFVARGEAFRTLVAALDPTTDSLSGQEVRS